MLMRAAGCLPLTAGANLGRLELAARQIDSEHGGPCTQASRFVCPTFQVGPLPSLPARGMFS
jgi:hypothetical protein